MKKQLLILMLLTFISVVSYCQTWDRNTLNNGSGGNNKFGTIDNFPILTFTDNTKRMKLNESLSYTVNGYNQPHNGHLLVGIDNLSVSDYTSIYSNKGAFSLLHLNGTGSQFQKYGYRPWMETGITLTANSDLSYLACANCLQTLKRRTLPKRCCSGLTTLRPQMALISWSSAFRATVGMMVQP